MNRISRYFCLSLAVMPGLSAGSASATTFSYVDNDSVQKLPDLPFQLSNHQVKVFGDYLVVTGGRDRLGKPVAQVLAGKIKASGSIDAWKPAEPLPFPLAGHAMESLNGYAYLSGGMKTAGGRPVLSSDVWMTQLGRDGLPGKWRKTADLPEGLQAHNMVAYGNSLYVIAGISINGFSNSVYKGDTDKDGRIKSWKRILGIPSALAYSAATVINGYILLIGGQSPGEGRTLIMPTLYVGPLIKDGEPTTWYLASSKLPGAWLGYGRCQTSVIAYKNTVMCFGGQDSSWFNISNIVAAGFDPEKGEIDGWGISDAPKDMPQITQAALWKDRVFLVGGLISGKITGQARSVRILTGERDDTK